MKIVISPFAAKLPEDRPNAKNYPWWKELIAMLNADGHEVIQIGTTSEPRLDGVSQFIQGFPLERIEQLLRDCDTWISIDSFLPHLCATMRLKGGIVIWAQSNPKIWGYPTNTNLLKDMKYLRERQYAPWYEATPNPDSFVSPEVVRDAVYERLTLAGSAVRSGTV
jgi:ADP-heptose:LPS heptosyltransferase